MLKKQKNFATRDMTQGFILGLVLQYSLPLMIGNVFQMLYNTVDSVIVGNYVGTQALAAIGSTTMIVNMAVLFFNGFSVGASVVIGRYFGAKNMDRLRLAVETTVAATACLCLIITLLGSAAVNFLLRFMDTPDDVFHDASLYLRIYFHGISGLLIYNMGSGILRAVGDTTRPLYYLIFTSILNVVLDLLLVLVFDCGIAGAAYATIMSQFVSAGLIIWLLTTSREVYQVVWKNIKLDFGILREILSVGIPTAVQSVVTQFSNVFVQSYVNGFGSACMAGWGCYNKLEQFVFLPIQSMGITATTFVSQNLGARKAKRAEQGALIIIGLCLVMTVGIGLPLIFFAEQAVSLFTADSAVVAFGIMFIQMNCFFIMFNCINHSLAGALRGMGDSVAPMLIMLLNFVVIRQVYLYAVTRWVADTPQIVGFGYPVGWMGACIMEVTYYLIKRKRFIGSASLGKQYKRRDSNDN